MTRIDDNPTLAQLVMLLTRAGLIAWVRRHRYNAAVRDVARAEFRRRRAEGLVY